MTDDTEGQTCPVTHMTATNCPCPGGQGCPLPPVEELLDQVHSPAQGPLGKLLPNPNQFTVPEPYRITHNGVWEAREDRNGEAIYIRVAWAPLTVVRIFTDADGNQSIELGWIDRGRPVTRTVPRSTARRGRLLVATLGDAGLPIIEADAKKAERWLAAVESVNEDRIPRVHLARQLGWQPDRQFVTGQDSPHRVEMKYDEQKPVLAAHTPHGTFQGWQAAVKRMEPYPAAQMPLYSSFGAPLLELLGLNSFTIDLSGRSTRGKTTAAAAGLSAWADPSERGDGMYSWRTTMLAAEKRLNLLNGLPVVFDESKLVRDPEIIHGLLYQVPRNHGQGRGGGWPSSLPWRTIVISTGEQSLLTLAKDQGAAARVLTVAQAPFGTDGEESADAAIEVRDGCADNYGTAGPRYITHLLDHLARHGKATLAARHRELTELHKGDSDIADRRAPLVACMALAAELAHRWDIVPFPPPEPEVWRQIFAANDQADNRGEMALDVVRELVAGQRLAIYPPLSAEERPPFSGWIGRETEAEGQRTFALMPQALKAALGRAGYDLDSVLPSWVEMGALIRNAAYRPDYLVKKKIEGHASRMYVFAPHVFASDDEDGE